MSRRGFRDWRNEVDSVSLLTGDVLSWDTPPPVNGDAASDPAHSSRALSLRCGAASLGWQNHEHVCSKFRTYALVPTRTAARGALAHRRPARGHRLHGDVRPGLRAPAGWPVRAADRGHRPGAVLAHQ